MAEVVCPECGTHAELPAIRRAAEEFCRQCDFPLFWAPSAVPAMSRGSNHDTTLRRLPGAGGRQRVGSKVCPACGELNPLGVSQCIRCDTDLDPKPPEPVVELPPPPPVVFDEPSPDPRRTPWWWWLVFGLVVAAAVVALIIWT